MISGVSMIASSCARSLYRDFAPAQRIVPQSAALTASDGAASFDPRDYRASRPATRHDGAQTMTSPFVPGPSIRIAGAPGGPLAGLTFAAKDLFDVAGHPTGGGNPDWARRNPVPSRHAWAVARLLHAGATLIGKT